MQIIQIKDAKRINQKKNLRKITAFYPNCPDQPTSLYRML